MDKATGEIVPQTRGRLDQSLGQATEQFEAAADRISDRQLVRVMEATRMVIREAAAQMDARVAESRALLHSAAASTLEEFRRQAEVQVDLAITETTERVRSALSALDAENRAACENRRRTMIDDVTRTTEQSTEQFRSGIKAFLYSCLVAAVGAVDEHAKTTLDGLVKDPGSARASATSTTSQITKIPSRRRKAQLKDRSSSCKIRPIGAKPAAARLFTVHCVLVNLESLENYSVRWRAQPKLAMRGDQRRLHRLLFHHERNIRLRRSLRNGNQVHVFAA